MIEELAVGAQFNIGYIHGVDHVKVAEGLGCKAIRVFEPDDLPAALERAKQLLVEYRVPVVVEVTLERVTNVSIGTEIDNVVEFEELALAGDVSGEG
jgi:tartronate-semialdehyde synthase